MPSNYCSARNFVKKNYARIPKLCSGFPKLWSQNDVDSVQRGAQMRNNDTKLSCYWGWEENTSIEMEIMKTKIFFSDSEFERFLERDTG